MFKKEVFKDVIINKQLRNVIRDRSRLGNKFFNNASKDNG